MKTGFCFLFILMFMFPGLSAQEINKKVFDNKSGIEILIGQCDLEGLKSGDFGDYFREEYTYYIPDDSIIEKLKVPAKDTGITIILGTWCHDSKEQVPRFYNILDALNYDKSKVKLIAVDRDKKAGDIDINEYGIERVPTFIFYRDGEETGRIIETPEESLEKDMLRKVTSEL